MDKRCLHGIKRDISHAAITDQSPISSPYKRHRPEQTLLYHIIEQHYPEFRDELAAHDCMDAGGRATQGTVAEGKALPLHVQQEFADYPKCGRPAPGFLRYNALSITMNIRQYAQFECAFRLAVSGWCIHHDALGQKPIS